MGSRVTGTQRGLRERMLLFLLEKEGLVTDVTETGGQVGLWRAQGVQEWVHYVPRTQNLQSFESSSSFQCWLWAKSIFFGYLLRKLSLFLKLAVFHVPWGASVAEFVLPDPALRQQLHCI